MAKQEKQQQAGRNRTPAAADSASTQQALNADLWARYVKRRDAGLREELILQYAPLVKYVMGRLAISLPSIIDYEDILSFGNRFCLCRFLPNRQ